LHSKSHIRNKQLVAGLLAELPLAEPDAVRALLARYCHEDVLWEIFHPFNTLRGIDAAAQQFWRPLKLAFPDYEHRMHIIIAGEYEGRAWVSTLGQLAGSFFRPWLDIPPTQGLCYLRFGCNFLFRDGKIAKVHILLDILDLLRQADLYPLRRMPGSAEQWPAPPACTGISDASHDGDQGANTMAIVRTMQLGLRAMDLTNLSTAEYSPLWHPTMNWYGPAGIGSSRAKRGFREYHGRLFLQGFPDRKAYARDHEGPQDGPGHYIRIGDGRFAVTSGWPSLHATHLGGGWCGLGPSGRRVDMRVADWYRLSSDDLLIENWVLIDILHICQQIGLDILGEMRFYADRTLRRWPDA
jgi:hypothetical protein